MRRIKLAQESATFEDTECSVYAEEALTAQQWQAVALLVAGKKQKDVAETVGVTQETVSRWRTTPVFAAALNGAVRDSYTATVGEVRGAAADAVAVLRECLRADDQRLRLSAALSILRLHVQLDATAQALPVTPADVNRDSRRRAQDALHADIVLGL